jgi:hypothetical protein
MNGLLQSIGLVEQVDDEYSYIDTDEVAEDTFKEANPDSEDQQITNDTNHEILKSNHTDDLDGKSDVNTLSSNHTETPKQTKAKTNNTEPRDQSKHTSEETLEGNQSFQGTSWNGNSTGTSKPRRDDEYNYPKQKPATKSGRLLSYAEPKSSKDESLNGQHSVATERKKIIERAAVEFFVTKAASQWRHVKEMPPNNPGFDFLAEAFDGNQEFIEIKGQSGAWTEEGVALTPKELRTAIHHGEHYWLCVVEYAEDQARRCLWMVQDPFGKADQFRFDRGWQDVAKKNTETLMSPESGLFVTIPGLGKAKILEVLGNGLLTKVQLELEDKSKVTYMFSPATMIVSVD